jgi:hypothetical protein
MISLTPNAFAQNNGKKQHPYPTITAAATTATTSSNPSYPVSASHALHPT